WPGGLVSSQHRSRRLTVWASQTTLRNSLSGRPAEPLLRCPESPMLIPVLPRSDATRPFRSPARGDVASERTVSFGKEVPHGDAPAPVADGRPAPGVARGPGRRGHAEGHAGH